MSNPIRIGLVGLGRAGWDMHCEEFGDKTDKFKLVAVCDLIDSRCQAAKERFGCKTYSKIEDLIADPDVEIVDIATRSCDHFKHAMMALEAGKDVFLEKPMTSDYEQAKKLQEYVSRPGAPKLFIRHNRRFEPGFMHVRKILDSGILGKILSIKLNRDSWGRRDDWQTLEEFSGGQLRNWGPHIVDHAMQFLGGEYESIFCDCKNAISLGDAEDHLKIVFRGKDGMLVDMEISGATALPNPQYKINGTRGSLVSEGCNFHLKYVDPKQVFQDRKARRETPDDGNFGTPEVINWIEETIPMEKGSMARIWDELYAAYREGVPFPVTLDQAVANMKVISYVKEHGGMKK